MFYSTSEVWKLTDLNFLSRIFVDALDSQFYKEHHDLGRCLMAQFKDQVHIPMCYNILCAIGVLIPYMCPLICFGQKCHLTSDKWLRLIMMWELD